MFYSVALLLVFLTTLVIYGGVFVVTPGDSAGDTLLPSVSPPSLSVRLQWTEGPSSFASRNARLCPILHLRSQVIEYYQFWQPPRAIGIWVLPFFTHCPPPPPLSLFCLSVSKKRTGSGDDRRNKSCQRKTEKQRSEGERDLQGMWRTMGYFVPGFMIGLCLISTRQLITFKTTSLSLSLEHYNTPFPMKVKLILSPLSPSSQRVLVQSGTTDNEG